MVEEVTVKEAENAATKVEEALAPTGQVAQSSNEATIESNAQGDTESSCNNNADTSARPSDADREKSLEYAEELMEKGSKAVKEGDFSEATDCFSRALEIRVAHHGELAFECVNTYYKYGCALLYKAQEEADPLATMPKKEAESHENSNKDGSMKNAVNDESSTASVNAEQDGSSNDQKVAADDDTNGKEQEEEEEESDDEDLAEADEDESDLDLAWKMLDVARAIVEKHSAADTMEKVDILSALAEVALEREDIETSLSDYQKALSILERLVEPDSRHIAELNFRICLCLEIGSKAQEAIPYCQRAISICKSRVQRLSNEIKSWSESPAISPTPELDQSAQQSSNVSQTGNSISDKESEIETLKGLASELEKKLEDLQQLVSNPTSILSEILGMMSAKARGADKGASPSVMGSSQIGTANSHGGFDSPTVSTASHTNGAAGVTHLGVVGRGVKRVSMNSGTAESSPMKKPPLDSSLDKGDDGSAS